MNKFGWMIYEKFRINIDDVVSTPSLAFKIYRTLFMPKDLDSLNIDYYNLFKDAYSPCGLGGHVNMYIPAGPIAEVIGLSKPDDKAIVPHNNKYVYHYDVNSLYPCAMKSFKTQKI